MNDGEIPDGVKLIGALVVLVGVFLCFMLAYDIATGGCFLGDACAGFYK